MTELPTWAPDHVDLDSPNAARVYDYYLGGGCNFATDREFGDKVIAIAPEVPRGAKDNRAFLRRSVRFLVSQGIRQFLDIGSGIPTVGNVHEVAQQADPECRVVYVDNEPVAVAHSELILQGNDRARVVQGDLCDPAGVLASEPVRELLNLDEPIGLLMVAVLHFVPDEHSPAAAIAGYLEALAPGSYLVMSHVTTDADPDRLGKGAELYKKSSSPMTPRTREQFSALFAGTEMLDPGVVWIPEWRPESPEDVGEKTIFYAGTGQKP